MRREDGPEEQLYLGTAESEHIEMYLKALWYIREKGQELKISSIAQLFEYNTTISCPDASEAR